MTQASSGEAADLQEFANETRETLAALMAPGEGLSWSATWSTRDNPAEYEFRRELARKLGARGWLFPTFPKEFGGGGLSAAHYSVLDELLSGWGLRLSMVYYTLARIVAPCILESGTAEQQRRFLPEMMAGDVVVWQTLTEPQSGSDVANCKTTALPDGDGFRISGQKVMVGSHHAPDRLWVLTCTDPGGPRHENLSWFYIPANSDGITIQPLPMLMGIKNTVFFDDVWVHRDHLIGGLNRGWHLSSYFDLEHGAGGSISGDPAVDRLLKMCLEPDGAGARLAGDAAVRAILADALIEAWILGLMGERNYNNRLAGGGAGYGGAQFRYFERMLRLRNAERAQGILGFAALTPDLSINENADIEHLVRSGPGQLHGGGTHDTDRVTMARRLRIGRP